MIIGVHKTSSNALAWMWFKIDHHPNFWRNAAELDPKRFGPDKYGRRANQVGTMLAMILVGVQGMGSHDNLEAIERLNR